jgi:RNA polymerase sigma-70 factor (ECF subfamily)
LIFYDSLYRYARALCHDPSAAEELVQETYKRALAAKRKPGGDSVEIRRWLFTITRHVWQNDLRQRQHDIRKQTEYESAAKVPVETPEGILARKLLLSEIRHALDCLPEDFREVIVLREIESLSYAEIAAILQCPSGTVMSRLSRARALLRRHLVGSSRSSRELYP